MISQDSKVARIILAMIPALLLAVSMAPAVSAEVTSNQASSTPPVPVATVIPATLPIGCYYWTDAAAVWQSIPCAPPTPPTPENTPTEGGSSPGLFEVAQSSGSTITFSEVSVEFSVFTSEYDRSSWGNNNNMWSIQANTPYFLSPSGYAAWDQFVYQNAPVGWPYGPYYRFCIWEWDLSTGSVLSNPCVTPTQQFLSSSYSAYISVNITPSDNLATEFCNVNTASCWAMIQPDVNGLKGNWQYTDGTILGQGGGSQAVFARPVTEYTSVEIGAPVGYTMIYPPNMAGQTAETNNLNPNTPSGGCSVNGGYNYCTLTQTSG